MQAQKSFTMQAFSLNDEAVHTCSEQSSKQFEQVQGHDLVYSRAVDQIRDILRAFQVQFGEEITEKGELLSRAVYSVDVQTNCDGEDQ